jgi:transposase
MLRPCLAAPGSQLLSLKMQILDFDRMILAWHRSHPTSERLNYIPGVGPLLSVHREAHYPFVTSIST